MLKRLVNLPFRVLGRAARAVQDREEQARSARYGDGAETAPRAGDDNIPELDVPAEFDEGRLGTTAAELRERLAGGGAVEFVDVRDTPGGELPPGTEHIPQATLGIQLAELPPAGQPIVVVAADDDTARRTARFLRWRGIEDADFLVGGAAAWTSSGR
jgi:rhodanese-related sulfurtransferase